MIGLFRELIRASNSSSTSINELLGGLPACEVSPVVEYLQRGTTVLDVMSYEPDVLDKNIFIVGAGSIMSDGFWIWRKDLSYYVEKYRLSLDKSFILTAIGEIPHKLNGGDIVKNYSEIIRCYDKRWAELKNQQ